MKSEVEIINNKLWVTVKLLIDYGISVNYIKKRLVYYRNGETEFWNNIPHPEDRRKKLILYKSIPTKTKAKLPTEEQLKAKIEAQRFIEKENKNQNQITEKVEYCKKEMLLSLDKHIRHFPDAKAVSVEFTDRKAEIICKNFAVIDACNDLREFNLKLKHILAAYHLVRLTEPDIKKLSISDSTPLRIRMDAVAINGIRGVTDKRVGNKRKNKKFTTELEVITEKAYSDTMVSMDQVKIILDNYCREENLDKISISTIKKHLCKPDVKNRILPLKFGEKYFNNHDRPYIPRQKPLFAGSKWVIDGTAIQFVMKDSNGKQVRLNFFVVFDAHSGKVLGFDFARSETSATVFNALKMAFDNTGYLPGELVSDNSAAIKSKEMERLFTRMYRLGTKVRNAKVGNAQDKEIEQFFRTFHRYCCSQAGWIGGNIPSQSNMYRPSKESLAKAFKQNGLPDEHTLKALICELIDQYNCDSLNNRVSPATKHKESKKKFVIKPTEEEKVFLFWPEKIMKVSKGMIIRNSGKEKFHYLVFNHDDKLKLNGQETLVKFDYNDPAEIHLFDKKTEAIICTCKRINKPNSALVEQTEQDELDMYKQSSHNESFRRHIKRTNQERAKEYKEVTGKDEIKYTDVYSIYKDAVQKSENTELDKYYDHLDIDPNQIDEKAFQPVESDEWESRELEKDYSLNPYTSNDDFKVIEQDSDTIN